MFFWNKDKKEIVNELNFLRMRSELQADVLEDLTARLDRYEQILLKFSKYGFKKDGQPKAKPGRKAAP
jgi:hypothetical protein